MRLTNVVSWLIATEKNCGPTGTFVPLMWTSQVPCAGLENFNPRSVSTLLESSVHVPDGSLIAMSKSFTRFVPADGVDSLSVHATTTLRSGAFEGTLKLQPRLTPVVTLSLSIHDVFRALRMSTRPQPSWLFGAVSPAPLEAELYWPTMSVALAAKIAFTRDEFGSS